MLGIVTCFFNPCGYQNIRENYFRFRDHLRMPLVTVELSFDQRFEIDDAIQIAGSKHNLMWQKERLLNIGIESLPPEFDKVAWVDADLLFLNSHWPELAEQALDELAVVHLCERIHFLNAAGYAVQSGETFGSAWSRGAITPARKKWYHTGIAWACRREILEPAGLYDADILGGADAAMAFAWAELGEARIRKTQVTKFMNQSMLEWQADQIPLVRKRIGCVRGDVCHFWHGSREERRYVERNQWLRLGDFNPYEDIEIDSNGLWRWCSPKRRMHKRVAKYFSLRNEDHELQSNQKNSVLMPEWLLERSADDVP